MVTSEQIASSLANNQRIVPTYGYYRQGNGWITVSPVTRLERVKYVERGWEHLGQYGAFDMSPYVANHPYEALFMFNGAFEMCVEQVLQTGLYIDPPLVPRCMQHLTQFHRGHTQACWNGATRVEFPQLEGVDSEKLGPFPCSFCERQMATIQAREQHQSVAHKEALGDLRTGTSLGTSLAEALNNRGGSGMPQPEEGTSSLELLSRIGELEKLVKELTPPEEEKKDWKAKLKDVVIRSEDDDKTTS